MYQCLKERSNYIVNIYTLVFYFLLLFWHRPMCYPNFFFIFFIYWCLNVRFLYNSGRTSIQNILYEVHFKCLVLLIVQTTYFVLATLWLYDKQFWLNKSYVAKHRLFNTVCWIDWNHTYILKKMSIVLHLLNKITNDIA